MNTQPPSPSGQSVDCENPKSTESGKSLKRPAMPGAGAKPLPPEQKMQSHKISAIPEDWDYLQLFIAAEVDAAERTPGHLFRAAIARLRLFAPNGPDRSFYIRPVETPIPPRISPAVSREAAKRGMSRAEYINAAHKAFMTQEQEGEK